ncbi:MAG: membrane integrity-associated transporter subunit PqiC [Desulfobacterium sp.]|nr:membrane integrity-associated transporter subunit PqiC [Desulfobacterium sp.]
MGIVDVCTRRETRVPMTTEKGLHSHAGRCRLLLLGLLILFSGYGCATQPSSYYVLNGPSPMVPDRTPLQNIAIGVGPVSIPGHLDRPQIVTRAGQHRIAINEFHRWGDSLKRQVAETLVMNLSALLQTPRVTIYPWERALRPQYQVHVTVHQFEGEPGKGTTLDAVWQIVATETQTQILTRGFTISVPVEGTGMAAYVKAQSTALGALSRDIAGGMYKVVQG